jgi:hypothetical protein
MLNCEKVAEVFGINGCAHEFAFDAACATFVPPQQIDGQPPHGGEVFGGLLGAGASLIFAKDHVRHPRANLYKPTKASVSQEN